MSTLTLHFRGAKISDWLSRDRARIYQLGLKKTLGPLVAEMTAAAPIPWDFFFFKLWHQQSAALVSTVQPNCVQSLHPCPGHSGGIPLKQSVWGKLGNTQSHLWIHFLTNDECTFKDFFITSLILNKLWGDSY